jgi:hypothetical protein
MIGGYQRYISIVVYFSPQRADAVAPAGQSLSGEATDGQNNLGLKQLYLTLEIIPAGIHLIRLRIAIARRTTLEQIGDEGIDVPIQRNIRDLYGRKPFIQVTTSGPNERLTDPVFFRPGCFADNEDDRLRAPCTGNCFMPGPMQAAVAASPDFFRHDFEAVGKR